jgi:hypothetical protein
MTADGHQPAGLLRLVDRADTDRHSSAKALSLVSEEARTRRSRLAGTPLVVKTGARNTLVATRAIVPVSNRR